MGAPLADAGWRSHPDGTYIDRSTARFINGDFGIPTLTISNVQKDDDGFYTCFLCYGRNETRCTVSEPVEVHVNGAGQFYQNSPFQMPQPFNPLTLHHTIPTFQ